MKRKLVKLVSLFTALILAISGLTPAGGGIMIAETADSIIDSGTCGDNLTWVLNADGTLTISGTGEMADSAFSLSSNSIVKVVVEEV